MVSPIVVFDAIGGKVGPTAAATGILDCIARIVADEFFPEERAVDETKDGFELVHVIFDGLGDTTTIIIIVDSVTMIAGG